MTFDIIISVLLGILLIWSILLWRNDKKRHKDFLASLQLPRPLEKEVNLLIKSSHTGEWIFHSRRPENHPDVHLVLSSHPEMAVQLPDGTIIPGKKKDGAAV